MNELNNGPVEGASNEVLPDYPLMHPWNDPDNDGHDCVDCPSDSIWKCSKFAHDETEKFRADVIRAMEQSRQKTAPVLAKGALSEAAAAPCLVPGAFGNCLECVTCRARDAMRLETWLTEQGGIEKVRKWAGC